jgi:hypothetical protein
MSKMVNVFNKKKKMFIISSQTEVQGYSDGQLWNQFTELSV